MMRDARSGASPDERGSNIGRQIEEWISHRNVQTIELIQISSQQYKTMTNGGRSNDQIW
jgi:hypothetical protein